MEGRGLALLVFIFVLGRREVSDRKVQAHQAMTWTRQRNVAMIRSMLQEYYPAALEAFADQGEQRIVAGEPEVGDAADGHERTQMPVPDCRPDIFGNAR